MKKIVANNIRETYALGVACGQACRGGEVFALSGNLGAGKTKWIQGLAAGLGVKARVNSPTFNILKIYSISLPPSQKNRPVKFCHIDAYRLKSAADLETLGIDEILEEARTVTAIEWAEKVKKIWPPRTKLVRIKSLSETKREIVTG